MAAVIISDHSSEQGGLVKRHGIGQPRKIVWQHSFEQLSRFLRVWFGTSLKHLQLPIFYIEAMMMRTLTANGIPDSNYFDTSRGVSSP
jgi:hypothetical protein